MTISITPPSPNGNAITPTNITASGRIVLTPTTVALTTGNAGNSISVSNTSVLYLNPNAALTLSGGPIFTGGVDGQLLWVMNIGTGVNIITLPGSTGQPTAGLRLSSVTSVALGPGGSMQFIYIAAQTAWQQVTGVLLAL